MPAVIITMLVILLLAAAIVAIVAMGMQGHAREVSPELADAMEKTARHLNGEADPPRGLVAILGEIDELPGADLPGRIRSRRSARSAASASSGDSGDSAASAGSASPASPAETPPSGRPAPAAGAAPEASEVGDRVVHTRLPETPKRR